MSARQSGFSLMETLVAIAIVALALVPLLELQTQLARHGRQQRDLAVEATVTQNALALLSGANPMAQAEGRIQDGAARIAWRARPLSTPVRSTRAGAGEGDFLIQLFETDVTVQDADGRLLARFTIEQIGWLRLSPDQQ